MRNSLFPVKQTKSYESKLSKHCQLQILLWSHVPKTRGTIDTKATYWAFDFRSYACDTCEIFPSNEQNRGGRGKGEIF